MKRVLTAVAAIPLVVLITLLAPRWFFAVAAGMAAALATEEFFGLAQKKGIGRPGRWFLGSSLVVTASFLDGPLTAMFAATLSALALLTAAIFSLPVETALGRVAVGLSGMLYCSVSLGFLVLMPPERTLLLFAIIWVGDAAAYYVGRALGQHLLAPKVSPKKTVEGAVAGMIGSLAVGTLAAVWVFHEPWMRLVGISAVTGVAGQLGDLAESVLKRSAGVKDSSSILPGHGGILDRLDSLLFAAPVFYWLLSV